MADVPATDERIQWDGHNVTALEQFLGDRYVNATALLELMIRNPDGVVESFRIPPNGWLVRAGSHVHVEGPDDAARTDRSGSLPLELLVDSLAYEGGFD